MKKNNFKTLRPKKYKVDFFIADEIIITSFRDEIATMEHPFFALKAGDTKTRNYKNGRVTVTVRSSAEIGLATIFDKDIWIYAISKLQEAINNNEKISRVIAFTPYNFFMTTNRDKGGRSYCQLEKTLLRLKSTVIQTNIKYSKNKKETMIFGLIEQARILEEKKGRLNVGMVEITLPDWLYQAITKTQVLQINSDYFRIRKAIDRRIYEIARKHCGSQYEFIISLEKLYLKSGSSASLKEFKRKFKLLIISNDLPDYLIAYDTKNDNVIFTNRNKKKSKTVALRKQKNSKQKTQKINNKLNIINKKTAKKIKFFDLEKVFKIPKGFRG